MKLLKFKLFLCQFLIITLLSCSTDSSCGKEIIKLNKRYEDLFIRANGDQDQREDIARKLFSELERSECINDQCNDEINQINESYNELFIKANGDKDQREDIMRAMWDKLNNLNCY